MSLVMIHEDGFKYKIFTKNFPVTLLTHQAYFMLLLATKQKLTKSLTKLAQDETRSQLM